MGATETERDAPLVVIYAVEPCLGNGREGENPGGANAEIATHAEQACA